MSHHSRDHIIPCGACTINLASAIVTVFACAAQVSSSLSRCSHIGSLDHVQQKRLLLVPVDTSRSASDDHLVPRYYAISPYHAVAMPHGELGVGRYLALAVVVAIQATGTQ